MKRFRFPLQPVAVLRAHREMKAREIFAASVQAFVQAEERLTAMRARVAGIEAQLAAGRQGRFSPSDEAQALAAYRQECTAELASEREATSAREMMQRRRLEYLEAHRQVEVVERLETKAREAHRFDCNREEQADFDEFAGRRFATKRQALSV